MASGVSRGEPTVDAGGPATTPTRPFTWRDICGAIRRRADELVSTDAEAAALQALRVATGETDGGMERHTVRQYLIAERIADVRRIPYDRELLLCASFLHDSGLYDRASTGDVYIKDSARYARRTLEPFGWPEQRLRVCLDACEQHHALSTRRWMATEVELVRRSDLVEVYPELRRFGIPRAWLKQELWPAVPRAGFWRETVEITRTHWRRMLPGIFQPPAPGQSRS
jgi:hypothetical protein